MLESVTTTVLVPTLSVRLVTVEVVHIVPVPVSVHVPEPMLSVRVPVPLLSNVAIVGL